LEQFLLKDRTRARNEATLGLLGTTHTEVGRFIATQHALTSKTIAQIEAEQVELRPRLERLRGIKRHIEGFLDQQSANLQDRLAISFHNQLQRIEKGLDAAVAQFDLGDVMNGLMTAKLVTDWLKSDEDKFAARLEKALKPQLTRHLEREFAVWQTSVVSNELKAVAIDVEKHLQEEAAEYRRVLAEIEERLGVKGDVIPIADLVERWVTGGDASSSPGGLQLSGVTSGIMGDLSWVIGSIVAEIMVHLLTDIVFVGIPFLGMLIVAVRMFYKEQQIRQNINDEIVKCVRQSLRDLESNRTADIRQEIKDDFNGLKRKVTSSIDEEIALIAGSLQAILDRKREGEQRAEQEQQRMDEARNRLTATADRIRPLLVTSP
jgi:hypothetical protein